MACNFLGHLRDFCRGFAYMVFILIYQLLSFAVCLFLSMVMAVFLAFSFEFCWGYTLPTFIICFIQACLLITSVQLHTVLHDGSMGPNMVDKIKEFPIFLNMMPVIFTCILSFGAYYEVFTEYYNIHLRPNENSSNSSKISTEKPAPRGFQTHGGANEHGSYVDNTIALLLERYGRSFMIFMVCFSYLVYTMAKVIQKDSSQHLRGAQHRLGKFNSVVILFSLLCQAALTFGYAIPMIYAAIFARWLQSSHRAVFFYISAISAVTGIGASFLETNEPFPTVRNLGPFFFFECQVKARLILLQYCILPFVYYWFLNFYTSIHVPFNATTEEHRFFLFTLTFAILVLHCIKIVSYGMLISRHPIYAFRRRRRRRPQHIDPDEQDPPGMVNRGVGPAQAVADPIQNPPGLVDPTLARANNNGQDNNNNSEDQLQRQGTTTDDQGASTDSSHGRRKRRRGRNLTGKWPWTPTGPNNTLPDLEVVESFMDDVWAHVAIVIDQPNEAQPGSSRAPLVTPLQTIQNRIQNILTSVPIPVQEDATLDRTRNADTNPDSNNNTTEP